MREKVGQHADHRDHQLAHQQLGAFGDSAAGGDHIAADHRGQSQHDRVNSGDAGGHDPDHHNDRQRCRHQIRGQQRWGGTVRCVQSWEVNPCCEAPEHSHKRVDESEDQETDQHPAQITHRTRCEQPLGDLRVGDREEDPRQGQCQECTESEVTITGHAQRTGVIAAERIEEAAQAPELTDHNDHHQGGAEDHQHRLHRIGPGHRTQSGDHREGHCQHQSHQCPGGETDGPAGHPGEQIPHPCQLDRSIGQQKDKRGQRRRRTRRSRPVPVAEHLTGGHIAVGLADPPEARAEDQHQSHSAQVEQLESQSPHPAGVGQPGQADHHEGRIGGGRVAQG